MGRLRPLVLVVLALSFSQPSAADLRKLDAHARGALARLNAGASLQVLGPRGEGIGRDGSLSVFIRGSARREELEAAGARVRLVLPGITIASIPPAAIEAVAALPGVERISGTVRAYPELDLSVPETGVNVLRGPGPAFAGLLNGTGVLVGDVDTGVDYDHGDFKEGGVTRFVKIWDQTVSDNPPPTLFPYGSEWSPSEINSNACTEDDPLPGHGSHVLGIAGGNGGGTGGSVPAYTFAGMAPKADLVMVKTTFNPDEIVEGVAYCFALAQSRGQNAVVNLSLGSHYGPHDGTSDFETALNALTGPGRIIVKSAGNDRGEPRHAEVVTAGGPANVTMSVTGSSLNALTRIAGYYESSENISVSITTPGGAVIGPVTRGNANASLPGTSTTNGFVYLENGALVTGGGDYEVYVEINVGSGQNMNGTWTFTFSPVSIGPANGEVDLWRYDPFSNSTSVLKTTFVQGLSSEELISEPGNADSLITVGAYTTRRRWMCCTGDSASFLGTPTPGNIATFSSPGPTRDGRQKPDLTAPGVAIASTNSLDTPQVCPPSGSSVLMPDAIHHAMNAGTSMAAPHVSGAVALVLQSFGAVSPSWVKAFLVSHAKVDAFTGGVWNQDFGHGKLHLDTSTPTLLSMFTAEPVDAGVELRWQLSEPERYASIDLERAESTTGPWVGVAAERREESGVTVMLDRTPVTGRTYFYRLQARTRTGERLTFGPLSATAGVRIASFALDPVYPNPTSSRALIEFALPHESVIRLSILDVAGREVAVLSEGLQRSGRHQATWSGTLDERRAPPGLYFVRMRTPLGTLVRRVAMTR